MFLLRIKSSKFLLQTAFVPLVNLMSFGKIWVDVFIGDTNLGVCKNKYNYVLSVKIIKILIMNTHEIISSS